MSKFLPTGRKLSSLLLFAVVACTSALADDNDNNYWVGPPGGGGAAVFENPDAADGLIVYGQSSAGGFCSAGVGAPYDCSIRRAGPFAGARMMCHNGVTDEYSGGIVDLDLNDGVCRRGPFQQPMLAYVEDWRIRTGRAPHTITCTPNRPGTPIVGLSDPSEHWTRLVSCIQNAYDDVVANPAFVAASGTPPFVVRGMLMVQGESDEGADNNFNNTYVADVLDFVDDFQAMVKGITGQTSDVVITWDNPSNWEAEGNILPPIGGPIRSNASTQLLDAAAQRPWFYVVGSKGHVTPTYPGGFEPTAFNSFEVSDVSAYHWSEVWNIQNGYIHSMHLYCAIFGGCEPGAPQITSAVWDGTDVVVTYDRQLVLDTTFCPAHWNATLGRGNNFDEPSGMHGFEILNVGGFLYDEPVFVGSPLITAVDVTGNVVRLTLDRPPQDFARVEVGNSALERLSSNPENGCDTVGAPYVQIYEARTETFPIPEMLSHAWAVIQSYSPIVNAIPAPADTSPGYVEIDAIDEYIEIADEATDVFLGDDSLTIALHFDTNGETVDGRLMRKFPTFRILFDHSLGVGSRLLFEVGGAGNQSVTDAFLLPTDSPDFIQYTLVYDSTAAVGDRIRHVIDCNKNIVDTEQGALTATLLNSAEPIRIGSSFNLSPRVRWREVAMWSGRAATEEEILSICRGRGDLSTLELGTPGQAPDYYFKPGCTDSLTGAPNVDNLGTVGASGDAVGFNHEAGDFVIDNPGLCP